MTTLEQASAIVKEYANNDLTKVRQDLATLMEFEGIDALVYRVYTPSFNDGDPCEFTVSFIGKPGFFYGYCYLPVIDSEGRISVLNYDDEIDEEEELSVPEESRLLVDEYFSLRCGPDSKKNESRVHQLEEILTPSYKLDSFQAALERIAELILETNSQGVIRLLEDGTLLISSDEYYCGY